jgi:hypothetical protein
LDFRYSKKSPLVAAAFAGLALLAPAAASAKFPALRAVVTIAGQVSGDETIRTQVPPNNSDCPAQVTQQHETATLNLKATFKPVVVPLRRTGFVLKFGPRGKGAPTGGSFDYDGTYLKDDPANPDACPTLASTSASAQLNVKPPPYPSWDGRSYSPDDIFYLAYPGGDVDDIHATPANLPVPQDEWDGSSSGLVPIDVPNSLPFYDTNPKPRLQLQAFDASVLLNWNKLQHRLRPLTHGRTVRLSVSTRVNNSHKPAPFDQQCPDVGPPSGPTDFGIVSCAESMSVRYTITIRRIGPAHGCDIATARHCLI